MDKDLLLTDADIDQVRKGQSLLRFAAERLETKASASAEVELLYAAVYACARVIRLRGRLMRGG